MKQRYLMIPHTHFYQLKKKSMRRAKINDKELNPNQHNHASVYGEITLNEAVGVWGYRKPTYWIILHKANFLVFSAKNNFKYVKIGKKIKTSYKDFHGLEMYNYLFKKDH